MRKKEFLKNLRNNLSGLPHNEIEEKINFYEEMINDRIDDGMTEEEAVSDIGTTDEAVNKIANETKMTTLIKEKIRPKRKLSTLEIVLLILGFPCWFPILIVGLVLVLLFYILIWVLSLVTYSVEISFIVGFIVFMISSITSLFGGNIFIPQLGLSFVLLGLSLVFFNVCVLATKINAKLFKRIFLKIKSAFIKNGGNK